MSFSVTVTIVDFVFNKLVYVQTKLKTQWESRLKNEPCSSTGALI